MQSIHSKNGVIGSNGAPLVYPPGLDDEYVPGSGAKGLVV